MPNSKNLSAPIHTDSKKNIDIAAPDIAPPMISAPTIIDTYWERMLATPNPTSFPKGKEKKQQVQTIKVVFIRHG